MQRSIRDERWKLIRYPMINLTQLFDLSADPIEMNNLAETPEYVGKVEQLLALMKKAQKEFDDPCPLTSTNPADPAWSPEKAVPGKPQSRKQ